MSSSALDGRVHSPLQEQHEKYFVQQVSVSSDLAGRPRLEVFTNLLAGKRVLHVGYADWPITDLANNLHVALDGVCAQLDGVDPHTEAAEALRPHVRGRLLASLDEVTDSYDVVLVPEVLEHVGNPETFFAELAAIDFGAIIITVPDAYSCSRHFDHDETTGVFTEVVHPDHNYWFTPYTFCNIVRKHTDWAIDGLWFLNGISLMMLASKPTSARAGDGAPGRPEPVAVPLVLPSADDAVAAARGDEHAERAALALGAHALPALTVREDPPTQLHVCYLMPRTDVGGGARIILEHATRLTVAGCRVTVLSHFPRPTWHRFSADFVQVPFGLELAEALPECDLVVAGYWDQVVAARSTGLAPVVHLEQGDAHLFEALGTEAEEFVRASMSAADHTITLSSANAAILAERYATPADVVPNAVDPAVFHPGPPASRRPYLLVVGWDGNAFKGIDEAHRAWTALRAEGRDLDLVWVTPQPPLQPRGRVVVSPSQTELADLYRGAAVYLHASHYESFPLPPLEAMACGAPVVATRNSGVLEYAADGENCLLVDVHDVAAMLASVGQLLDDARLATSCREGGLRTAGSHTWSTITRSLLDTYRHVARSRPQRRSADSWRLALKGLTPRDGGVHDMLRLRLESSAGSRITVPVSFPAFEGHSVVRWQVVGQRTDGNGRTERAYLPHSSQRAPRDFPYVGAVGDLAGGRADRALTRFVEAHRACTDNRERAVLGRWITLALLENDRADDALAVATSGVADHPDYADYHYLATVVGSLTGHAVDLDGAIATATLLGPAARYPEWFDDVAGLLTRQG